MLLKFFRLKPIVFKSRIILRAMSNDSLVRVERDSFGEINVPANKYYGANTARSLIHFNIGGPTERMPVSFNPSSSFFN